MCLSAWLCLSLAGWSPTNHPTHLGIDFLIWRTKTLGWLKVHSHLTFPPAGHKDSDFFTSSLTLAISHFFDSHHPSGCRVVPHCGFVFSQWLVMLSIFSCAYRQFIYLHLLSVWIFCVFNNFIVIKYNKPHICKVCNLPSFHICTHLVNHHHNQDTKYFYQSPKFPDALL